MHTTQQAKTLWCPMARVARHEVVTIYRSPVGNLTPVAEEHHIVGGTNRDALASPAGFVLNSCKCVADQCAMWRWGTPVTRLISRGRGTDFLVVKPKGELQPTGLEQWEFIPFNPDSYIPAHWLEPQAQADARRTGYCGLAGNPVAL